MRYSTKAVLGFDIFCVREVVIVKESDDESEGEEELDGAGEAWRGMEVTSSEEINPCVTGEWEAASAAAAADRVTLVASMKGDVAAVPSNGRRCVKASAKVTTQKNEERERRSEM